MQFLIDADLPRSTVDVLIARSHEALDVRDVGLGAADDGVIAARAIQERACLITCDFGFADVRNYPPVNYFGMVVLELPKNATAAYKLTLVEKLIDAPDVLDKLTGRLAIVAANRIRLRPPG